MTITAAIVLYAMIWFMIFLIVLPLRMVTQGEAGEVVPGTPSSAPVDAQVGRKARITTLWATGLWIVIAGIIISGVISIRDIDWFNRMSTPIVSRE